MRIALSGYYGFDNAGDEALLSAITSSIRELAPEAEFVVFSGNPGSTSKTHCIPAVYYKSPLKVMRSLMKSELLISGGGSIFQDVTSGRSLPYYIGVVALAKLIGKPVMFYAQGIGPINRKISKFLMRLVANRVDLISLRDQESARLLHDIGVDRPPVMITADPVLALQPGISDQESMAACCSGWGIGDKPLICVSVRHWPALDGYQQHLALVLDGLVRRGYTILFVPMHWPEDVSESRLIMSLMEENSSIVDRKLNSKELLALIARSELLLGMRLHALIFAASQGVLFAGISYDPKVDAFLKSYGLEPLPLDSELMQERLLQLVHSGDIKADLSRRSLDLRDKSKENAVLALSLIRS
ncbi:MAG: polysaccharide pyruvyl transferase CsaB [Syntrophomonas sp.]